MNPTEWASFWAFVCLLIFIGIMIRLGAPGMIAAALDKRTKEIEDQLAEARYLREEAQKLLAEYRRKQTEAEEEARHLIEVAHREAAMFSATAKAETEEFIARRNIISEQKIAQAEQDAIKSIHSASAELAVSAVSSLIPDHIDEKLAAKLFHDSLSDISGKMH